MAWSPTRSVRAPWRRCIPFLETLELRGSPSTLWQPSGVLFDFLSSEVEAGFAAWAPAAEMPRDADHDESTPSETSWTAVLPVHDPLLPSITIDALADETARAARDLLTSSLGSIGPGGGTIQGGGPEDDSPPMVFLSAPFNGDEVSGTQAEFFGDGYDDVGTLFAAFYVDDQLEWLDFDNPKEQGHYHYAGGHNAWDTTYYENGPHRLLLVVYDTAWQAGYSEEVTVMVNNKI